MRRSTDTKTLAAFTWTLLREFARQKYGDVSTTSAQIGPSFLPWSLLQRLQGCLPDQAWYAWMDGTRLRCLIGRRLPVESPQADRVQLEILFFDTAGFAVAAGVWERRHSKEWTLVRVTDPEAFPRSGAIGDANRRSMLPRAARRSALRAVASHRRTAESAGESR